VHREMIFISFNITFCNRFVVGFLSKPYTLKSRAIKYRYRNKLKPSFIERILLPNLFHTLFAQCCNAIALRPCAVHKRFDKVRNMHGKQGAPACHHPSAPRAPARPLPLPLFTLFYYARNKSFICLSRSSLRKTINHSPCFTMSSRTTQKTLARADWGSGSDNKNVSFSHTKQITCRQSEVSLCRLCKETSPRFPPPPSPPPLTPLLIPSYISITIKSNRSG